MENTDQKKTSYSDIFDHQESKKNIVSLNNTYSNKFAWDGCNYWFIRLKFIKGIRGVTAVLGKGGKINENKLVGCSIRSAWHVVNDS